MNNYKVIVQVELEYTVRAKDKDEAEEQACNIELPKEYREDTFEILDIKQIRWTK